jgi:phage shock protein PspC (stress-responsive transcriptional regulator)
MNKTVTINISGIIFHIEEDAYDSLSKYLSTIKGYFSNTDGGNEIMGDIEARIAELLQARINPGKQVILMSDVEQVMNIMGKPEDFGADQSAGSQKEQKEQAEQQEHEKVKRRLFRDPDERVIGGVCSGLAAYFDIDTVWVRLAMFLLIFFGGISLWVYIILWIIIPRATTTAEKFAMRGESANINNILKNFKEEAEDVKNRLRDQRYGDSVRSNASRVLSAIFSILGRLVGLFLFFIGAVLLFGYVVSLFGISVVDGNTDLSLWKRTLFESPSDYALGLFAFIIVCGIPIFMLIYAGIKLMFRIIYSNRWLNLSLGILWAIGLVIGFYVTVTTVKEFNENSRIKETVELHGIGDTLTIKLNPALVSLKGTNFDNEDDVESYINNNHSGYYFGESGKNLSIIGYADVNVAENTSSDSVEMIITRSSRGGFKKDANESARSIRYAYKLEGNTLILDEVFQVASGSKFRAQELDIKIRLPKGKVIYLDKSLKYALDDVDNTTNTWDGDMINRRWKMTDKGLECIDCDDLEHVSGWHHDEWSGNDHQRITINGKGIHVNESGTDIKIDEDGIRINTPEKDMVIKKDNDKEEKKVKKEKKNDTEEK